MSSPQLTVIPLRPVVASDAETLLDVLLRIDVPSTEQLAARPRLNLGLVLDRSGSMGGDKLRFAKEAAAHLIDQLSDDDRVSLTVFDDDIRVVVPSVKADNKRGLKEALAHVHAGGSTDLYGGWKAGAHEVLGFLDREGLNRVIVLSDGEANRGRTNPDSIAERVQRMLGKGVSTSTMGVGLDYNEDLMAAMARSGDGNYYFLQQAMELAPVFRAELHGLAALAGSKVGLLLELGREVTVLDVFNDFRRSPEGAYQLPNLVMGQTLDVVVRLRVPPTAHETEICRFRVSYDVPGATLRQHEVVALRPGVITRAQLVEFTEDARVEEALALLQAARARAEAIRELDRGDVMSARQTLMQANMSFCAMPASDEVMYERAMLTDLAADLDAGEMQRARKKAHFQAYQRRTGKE